MHHNSTIITRPRAAAARTRSLVSAVGDFAMPHPGRSLAALKIIIYGSQFIRRVGLILSESN
eukprot:5862387-Prymnesium_polylepis.1